MDVVRTVEAVLIVLAQLAVCAAWWYAAFRFRQLALIWAIAVVETLATLTRFADFLYATWLWRFWAPLDHLQYDVIVFHTETTLLVLRAVTYLLLVRWLLSRLISPRQ